MDSSPRPRHTTARLRRAVVAALVIGTFVSVAVAVAGPAPTQAQAPDPGELSNEVIRTDGVEGVVVSQANPKITAHVWDIEFVGNTAYVAGQFLRVIRATTDWARIDQPFLAAFDASTGQWEADFRPVLDGPVWALDQADGMLLAGGEFTTVNGEARAGVVGLDPLTGATDGRFTGSVERRFSDKKAVVRDLHVDGDRLYVVGNFSHAAGGGTSMAAAKAVRFDTATGAPDSAWTPVIAGRSAWAVDTSVDGSRVFLGGEFSYVNGVADTDLFAAVDATAGALIPGFDNGFNVNRHRAWPLGGVIYDLAVAGDKVFLAGAEHFWESRSVSDGSSISLVLQYQGRWFNDTQVAELEGGKVYIGCHCLRHRGYANHDIDPVTDEITGTLTSGMAGGDGVWATAMAPDGCLWMGGDLRGTRTLYGAPVDGTMRWVGRFARFCPPGGPPAPPQTDHVLVDAGSTWDVSTATDWPAGWTEPGFDARAAGWTPAQAEFGYGDGDEATAIDDAGRPGAVVARAGFDVSDPGRFQHLKLDMQVDDGATVWINGAIAAAHNMNDGEVGPTTLAASGVWGRAETQWHTFRLDPSLLVDGRNVIAVTVHQGTTGSRDLGFDLALTGSTDRVISFDPTPAVTLAAPPPAVTVLRAVDDEYRYLVGTSAPPADWTDPAHDDGAWTAGSGVLGFGEDGIVTTEAAPGATTYYFRARFDAPADAVAGAALVELTRDDGVVVYLNGAEIGRDTMPDGPIDFETRATRFLWGAAESDPVRFTIPAGSLRQAGNVLAVEVHQAHPDSRDLRLGVEIRSNP
ncbi:MAG: hypothetical protein AAF547_20215 [Actinomycetota bacterium]